MNYTATIKLAGEVLFEGVTVTIHETEGSPGNFGEWTGSFTMPRNPQAFFNSRGPFALHLEDGRAGEFITTDTQILPAPGLVSITGAGVLK